MTPFMARNFRIFLYRYHWEILTLLALGQRDRLTEDIWQEYLAWCQSDEAKPYFNRKVITS